MGTVAKNGSFDFAQRVGFCGSGKSKCILKILEYVNKANFKKDKSKFSEYNLDELHQARYFECFISPSSPDVMTVHSSAIHSGSHLIQGDDDALETHFTDAPVSASRLCHNENVRKSC